MKKAILTAIALASTATLAFAEQPKGHPEGPRGGEKRVEFLKEADTNKDGSVSKEEFKAFFAAKSADHFKKLDTNGDGVLSLEEFSAASGKSDEAFERLDANKDGVINDADREVVKERFKEGQGGDVPPPPPPAPLDVPAGKPAAK
jgi:Ca2+-binding EF-hand superfamily protein